MKLTPLSEIRRRELRRAAFEVLQTEGLAGATLEKIAAKAGASKGIVLHYFANKRELFAQVMREANLALRDAVVENLGKATTPEERLAAIIGGNFESSLFQPLVCQAWLSLCAELPREPELARIQRVIHARMDLNLRSALRGTVPDELLGAVCLSLSCFIDGVWLRKGVAPEALSRAEALQQLQTLVRELTGLSIDFKT